MKGANKDLLQSFQDVRSRDKSLKQNTLLPKPEGRNLNQTNPFRSVDTAQFRSMLDANREITVNTKASLTGQL